jgi:beta-galactosidase
MAQTIDHFAKITKQETGHTQVVGTFYGYTFEEFPSTFGSYALREIIDSPNLDFFSSPNSYTNNRAFGIDWADMMPVDSLKRHGKLPFIECDIRTFLTTGIQEARPARYPDDIYQTGSGSVWAGPPTAALSQAALRKSFAHQITKGSGIWWFDMWGGWYRDPLLMAQLAEMKQIYDRIPIAGSAALASEVVFFADEQSYANKRMPSSMQKTIKFSRIAMGKAGVPYDSCMVEDAEAVLGNYKAAVFPVPTPSEAGMRAMALCRQKGIPYLTATQTHLELTTGEIRRFLADSGVHLYTEENDVVYAGNGYLGLHSTVGGTKTLKLPGSFRICPVFGAETFEQVTDTLVFDLQENGTALFSVHTP